MTTTASKRPQLNTLTSLRFFAAVFVVFFHCGQLAFEPAPDWMRRLIMNGYQAVSFFFVLSGFVLTYSYYADDNTTHRTRSHREFWIARFARIYPIYVVGLAVAIVPFVYKSFVNPGTSLSNFFAALMSVPLLLQSWIPPIALSWNGPAWSLSVETVFYLMFPILVRLVARLTAGRLLAVTAICVVLANLARHYAQPLPESGAAEIASKSVHYFFAYFPLFHVPGFLFGMALGRAFLEWNRAFNRTLASAIFAVAMVLLGGLFSMFGQIDPVFLSDAMLIPIYGVIILSATSLNWPIRSLLEQKVLVVAGEASYGLYIIHAPLWFLTNVGLSAIGLAAWRGPNLFWFFLPFVIGCSVIAFYRIERPWRIRLKTRLTESLCAIPSGTAQSTIARPLVSGR